MSDFSVRLKNLEQKVCCLLELGGTSAVSNVLGAGNDIATHTNSEGIVVVIKETITTMVDNGDNTFTYTNEAGVPTVLSFEGGIYQGSGTVDEDTTILIADGNDLSINSTDGSTNSSTTFNTASKTSTIQNGTNSTAVSQSVLTNIAVSTTSSESHQTQTDASYSRMRSQNSGGTKVSEIRTTVESIDLVFVGSTDLRINGDPGKSDQVLTSQAGGLNPIWKDLPAAVTIYSANGALEADRTITGVGNDLIFDMTDGDLQMMEKWSIPGTKKSVEFLDTITGDFSTAEVELDLIKNRVRTITGVNTDNYIQVDSASSTLLAKQGAIESKIEVIAATGINVAMGTGRDFRINGTPGTDGQFIRSFGNGNNAQWANLPTTEWGFDLDFEAEQVAVVGAEAGKIYPVNTTGGAINVVPPASPVKGDTFAVFDSRSNAATNNITVTFTTVTQNVQGVATNFTLNTDGQTVVFTYVDATIGWVAK